MDKTKPIAVFDFDNTLTRVDTLSLYLRFMAKQRGLSILKRFPLWIVSFLSYKLGKTDAGTAKAEMLFQVLKGLNAEQIEHLSAGFANEIDKVLCKQAIATLRAHQALGHHTILLSASIAPALRHWAQSQSFDRLIATNLAFDSQGYVLKQFDGANCKGTEKLRRLVLEIPQYYDRISYAYGDSKSDLPVLGASTHSYYKRFPDEDFLQE